jgi:hydrogenase 3 maturation protease
MDGKPFVLVGVGNALRRDDGVGPFLARKFSDPAWYCLDAGTAPENYSSLMMQKSPELVILADAAQMGLAPGSVRRIPTDRLDACGMGTHAMPLSFLVRFLERNKTVRVLVIGIQPAEIVDGEGLSPVVEKAADEICSILRNRAWGDIAWWTGGPEERSAGPSRKVFPGSSGSGGGADA